jgi:hypothetical protein
MKKNITVYTKKFFNLIVLFIKMCFAPLVMLIFSIIHWIVTKKDFNFVTILLCSTVWFPSIYWINRQKNNSTNQSTDGIDEMSFDSLYGFRFGYWMIFAISTIVSFVLTVL